MECIASQTFVAQSSPMLAKQIGANIEAARKARKWSAEKLAAKISPPTSYQHIRRLEKGEPALDIEWIEKIARALRVDPIELVTGPGSQASDPALQLSEQVAGEVARTLAAVALQDESPDDSIVQVVALALQELLQTFSKRPQAASDAVLAQIATDVVGRRYVPSAH